MTREEFYSSIDTSIQSLISNGVATPALLKEFGSYCKKEYIPFKEPAEDFSRYESVLFSIHTLTPEELQKEEEQKAQELKERLEAARKKDTFSDLIIWHVYKSGETAPDIYHEAGIDAKHYSKIISNKDYKPSKETVLAFALALKLSMEQTKQLLESAGFSFNSANLFDVAIQYFIEKQYYNREAIDAIMTELGLPLLPQNFG